MVDAMDPQLRAIYEADQADRRRLELEGLRERDDDRCRQVDALLANGQARSSEDFFHAAMVLQHGGSAEDYYRAHELAKRATEMGYEPARWLTAAAVDRWLMSTGRPQKYGTQYREIDGNWVLHDVDPTTTDDERVQWNVPTLQAAIERSNTLARPPTVNRAPS